jgi:hypothetical protein
MMVVDEDDPSDWVDTNGDDYGLALNHHHHHHDDEDDDDFDAYDGPFDEGDYDDEDGLDFEDDEDFDD